jgi:hypothetical protein
VTLINIDVGTACIEGTALTEGTACIDGIVWTEDTACTEGTGSTEGKHVKRYIKYRKYSIHRRHIMH